MYIKWLCIPINFHLLSFWCPRLWVLNWYFGYYVLPAPNGICCFQGPLWCLEPIAFQHLMGQGLQTVLLLVPVPSSKPQGRCVGQAWANSLCHDSNCWATASVDCSFPAMSMELVVASLSWSPYLSICLSQGHNVNADLSSPLNRKSCSSAVWITSVQAR